MKTTTNTPRSPERAVRLVLEYKDDHESEWAAICSISAKIGCTAEKLRRWVRRANEILRSRLRISPGGARPPLQAMKAYIDEHRAVYGVEPICRVLPIAPSIYNAPAHCEAARERRSREHGVMRC